MVTGATGYLGSHLTRRLRSAGHRLIVAKRSTSRIDRIADILPELETFDLDRGDLSALFARERLDLVLHCATDYGRKQLPPSRIIEANLVLPLRLLELSVESGVRTFVNTDTILDKRVSHYSLSKRQFSEWLSAFSVKMTGLNVSLEHFYGPGDDDTKFVSRMVSDIVAGVARIALTPGEQKRDFIYIDDVADAFMRLIHHADALGAGFHRFEVGSGRAIPIKELVTLIARLAGNATTRLDFGAVPYRDQEIMESRVDIAPLKKLGWAPRVALDDGIRRTIEAARAKVA